MPKKTPAVTPKPLVREVKTYRWPGHFLIVHNPAPTVFLVMVVKQVDGHEVFILDPEIPVFPTLELAQGFIEETEREVQALREGAQKPQLYVPPGRGKMQA